MIEHRSMLIKHYCELQELLVESIEYVGDEDIEFLIREMAIMLERVKRHIDMEL